jgi:hypothetical protein
MFIGQPARESDQVRAAAVTVQGYPAAIQRDLPGTAHRLGSIAAHALGRDWNGCTPDGSLSRLPPVLGLLYHNGAFVYHNEARRRHIVYGSNRRRTNRARIADMLQILVCSPQYVEMKDALPPGIVESGVIDGPETPRAQGLGRPFLSIGLLGDLRRWLETKTLAYADLAALVAGRGSAHECEK